MENSHGFISKFTDKQLVSKVELETILFLKNNQETNYISNFDQYVPEVRSFVSKDLLKKASELLLFSNPILKNIELHVQAPNCKPIPPHQDNFYHCVNPLDGLKFLIPLNLFNLHNGALSFLDVPRDFPIIDHEPSDIENFSSFIPDYVFKKLNHSSTSYEYQKGDMSYHFLNSVHFSFGNKSKSNSLFLVFRFEKMNSKQDDLSLLKYSLCVEKHKKILGL